MYKIPCKMAQSARGYIGILYLENLGGATLAEHPVIPKIKFLETMLIWVLRPRQRSGKLPKAWFQVSAMIRLCKVVFLKKANPHPYTFTLTSSHLCPHPYILTLTPSRV